MIWWMCRGLLPVAENTGHLIIFNPESNSILGTVKGPQAIAPVGTRCLHLQFPDKLLAGAQPWIQSFFFIIVMVNWPHGQWNYCRAKLLATRTYCCPQLGPDPLRWALINPFVQMYFSHYEGSLAVLKVHGFPKYHHMSWKQQWNKDITSALLSILTGIEKQENIPKLQRAGKNAKLFLKYVVWQEKPAEKKKKKERE